MPSSLRQGPPSFRQRFARGRLGPADVAAVAVVGTALCGLALLGLDAVLVDHPVRAVVAAPAAAAFTVRDLGPYVGNWVSDGGARLIVTKSGAVWADQGALIGAARLDRADRTRLLVEGAAFRCSYRIASERPDALLWTVVENTPGTACPEGRYSRRFTF